jgi:predicted RNase H-like HicB family nuclease
MEGMELVTLVFEPAEEGGYSAYVAEVPGANSQGETLDEAKQMVLEALHELLEYRREKARRHPGNGIVYEQVALA